jgi:3-methyl-2-oxobutanoate hydroxymethyltransferase
MDDKVTLPALQRMKRDGRKIVGVVAWDTQIARVVDRAGVELVSVGDTVGVNVWGREDPLDVTLDEMVLVCRAVRAGVERALVSCDFPFGPLQEGTEAAVRAARRLVDEGGADLVKLDGAAEFPEAVTAVARAGIPVFAQFGATPQSGSRSESTSELVAQAKRLEEAGAALLDFTESGPEAGPEAVRAVAIPVLGGLGGGPWLDGRMRMIHRAIGYSAAALDDPPDAYANVAQITYDAITAYADDVRGGRQIKGA